jgi:hypothetical protein
MYHVEKSFTSLHLSFLIYKIRMMVWVVHFKIVHNTHHNIHKVSRTDEIIMGNQ